METEFNFDNAKVHHDDAFTVIGNAIKRQYGGDSEKIQQQLWRIMAKMIDDGFLDSVIAREGELVTHQKELALHHKKVLHDLEIKIKEQQRAISALDSRIYELNQKKDQIEIAIRAYEGKRIADAETDPAIIGAKKAYEFMLEETNNRQLASKAFNSYLLGGRYDCEVDENDGLVDVDAILQEKRKVKPL